jgi:hypothetical protein
LDDGAIQVLCDRDGSVRRESARFTVNNPIPVVVSLSATILHVIRDDRDYVMVSILGFGDAAAVSEAAERLARAALVRI